MRQGRGRMFLNDTYGCIACGYGGLSRPFTYEEREVKTIFPLPSLFDFEGIHTQVTRRVRHATRRPVHLAIALHVRLAKNAGSHRQRQRASWILFLSTLKIAQEASPRTYLELPVQEPMKILWR